MSDFSVVDDVVVCCSGFVTIYLLTNTTSSIMVRNCISSSIDDANGCFVSKEIM